MQSVKMSYYSRIVATILLFLGIILLFLAIQRSDIQTVRSLIEGYTPIFH